MREGVFNLHKDRSVGIGFALGGTQSPSTYGLGGQVACTYANSSSSHTPPLAKIKTLLTDLAGAPPGGCTALTGVLVFVNFACRLLYEKTTCTMPRLAGLVAASVIAAVLATASSFAPVAV